MILLNLTAVVQKTKATGQQLAQTAVPVLVEMSFCILIETDRIRRRIRGILFTL